MRQRIFEVIEVGATNDKASRAYDIFMMITIFVSIVPLAIKHHTQPSSIITAGYIDELKSKNENKNSDEKENE